MMNEVASIDGAALNSSILDEKNDDVEFQTRQTKSGFLKSRKCLYLIIAVLSILVLIFFILLLWFALSKPKHEEQRVCKTASCTFTSAGILTAMNRSADPCDDFYEYACGNWMKNEPIPDTRTSWSQFKILYKRNEAMMKQLILDPKTRTKYSKNKAILKAFDYYDACVNEVEIEKLGAKPLHDLIKDYGSWNVTDKNFTASTWDFMGTFVRIQKYLSIAPLFNMFVAADLKDSTKNVIVFDQSGTALSRETFFFNTSYHAKIRNSYKILMTDLMRLLGAGDEAEARMKEVYAFEEELATNFIPREQRRDSNKMYNKMTLRKLINLIGANATLNLTDFLERMFADTGYKITEDENVIVYAMEYMKNVTKIINKTDKRIMANYMMWHVAMTYAPYLSLEYNAIFDRHRERVSGTSGKDPRWQGCMSSVQSAFGMAVGLLFIDAKFSGESKKSAEEMIHAIRSVFIDNLKDIDWMDDETKKVAKQKAQAIRENIGYPNYIANATALAEKYEGFAVRKTTYFKNNFNRRTFNNMKNYKEIGKPVDKTVWSMTPPTVNAYYSSTDNKIVFPAGILQDPFYSQTFPLSLNYGGIGMVVGHEISHGFDDNGRKFNKDGNLVKWWSNNSIANFVKKTDCLVKQYGKYTFHGKKLNGRQTLGENIADNGGIKQSYQAYQIWKKKHGEELKLPGLEDFSHEKLFFLGFAQIWCSAFRQSAAISAIENGVHSPGKWRVIGSLSNFNDFSKAYGCPIGSRMNPEEKCSVW